MPNTRERFEEKFGKKGPEGNSDSIGVKAGCDDCAHNIKLRDEHLAFVESEKALLLSQVEQGFPKVDYLDFEEFDFCQDVKAFLHSLKEGNNK